MSTPGMAQHTSFAELARAKLTRVLGPERGAKIYAEVLAELALDELRTADDLHAFGERLSSRRGFEAAVGSLLAVDAILRGAKG